MTRLFPTWLAISLFYAAPAARGEDPPLFSEVTTQRQLDAYSRRTGVSVADLKRALGAALFLELFQEEKPLATAQAVVVGTDVILTNDHVFRQTIGSPTSLDFPTIFSDRAIDVALLQIDLADRKDTDLLLSLPLDFESPRRGDLMLIPYTRPSRKSDASSRYFFSAGRVTTTTGMATWLRAVAAYGFSGAGVYRAHQGRLHLSGVLRAGIPVSKSMWPRPFPLRELSDGDLDPRYPNRLERAEAWVGYTPLRRIRDLADPRRFDLAGGKYFPHPQFAQAYQTEIDQMLKLGKFPSGLDALEEHVVEGVFETPYLTTVERAQMIATLLLRGNQEIDVEILRSLRSHPRASDRLRRLVTTIVRDIQGDRHLKIPREDASAFGALAHSDGTAKRISARKGEIRTRTGESDATRNRSRSENTLRRVRDLLVRGARK